MRTKTDAASFLQLLSSPSFFFHHLLTDASVPEFTAHNPFRRVPQKRSHVKTQEASATPSQFKDSVTHKPLLLAAANPDTEDAALHRGQEVS